MNFAVLMLAAIAGLSAPPAPELAAPDAAPTLDRAHHADNAELAGYIEEAVARNPELQALHARWLAALQRVPQARSLDDPMFRFSYFVKSPGKDFQLVLGQTFPWFGTLRARADEAAHEAEAAFARMLVARNRIVLDTKLAYYELAALDATESILEAESALRDELEKLARERYALGMEMQDDVLRLENERETQHDQLLSLRERRPAVAAALNEAAGRELLAEVAPPSEMVDPPAPPEAPDVAALIQRMHPELRELEAMADAAEAGVVVARKMGYPEIALETMYEFGRDPGSIGMDPLAPGRIGTYRRLAETALGRTPFNPADTAMDLYDLGYRESMKAEDEWSITLGLSLPIWRKKVRAGVTEAEQEVRAIEFEQAAVRRRLEREVHGALFRMRDAERQYRLVRERLHPTAARTTAIVRERYASGDLDTVLAEVLMATGDEFAIDRMGVDLLRAWRSAAAEVEFLLGGPWE